MAPRRGRGAEEGVLDLFPTPQGPPPTFDDLTQAVLRRGAGITLAQIGAADALARALASPVETQDRHALTFLARRLGIDLENAA